MQEREVRETAFAMPLTAPAYPRGPYRFVDREYFVVTYRTDAAKLRALVPQPLQLDEPLVKFEFIRMPNSTGLAITRKPDRSSPYRSRAAKALTRCACFSTIIRR